MFAEPEVPITPVPDAIPIEDISSPVPPPPPLPIAVSVLLSAIQQPIRRRKVLRDNLEHISKASIKQLARRGGVIRMSEKIYKPVRKTLKEFLSRIIQDAVVYVEHAKRKTVTSMDIVYALKNNGMSMYG